MQPGSFAMYEHVLVADDHPIFRDRLSELMEELHPGARVRQSGTFGELLEQARAIPLLRREFANSAIAIAAMADSGGRIAICVYDRGPGVTERDLRHLTQRCFRAGTTD